MKLRSSSSADQIRKFNGPHRAPGSEFAHAWSLISVFPLRDPTSDRWKGFFSHKIDDRNLVPLVAPQVVLINAVKDVAKALGNLISTTKAAAGKPYDDPSMLQLKSSAKVSTHRATFRDSHFMDSVVNQAGVQLERQRHCDTDAAV